MQKNKDEKLNEQIEKERERGRRETNQLTIIFLPRNFYNSSYNFI